MAKPGQASKLAKLFKNNFAMNKEMANRSRVLTDVVGPYNTVIMEVETDSLAEWEKYMNDHKAGKTTMKTDPEASHYTDMFFEGRREIFRVMD